MFANQSSESIADLLFMSINVGQFLSAFLLLFCLALSVMPLQEPKENAATLFRVGLGCCIAIPLLYFFLGFCHKFFEHNEFAPDPLWSGILTLSSFLIACCQIGAVYAFKASTKSRLVLVMLTGVCSVCVVIYSTIPFLL